MYSSSCFCGHLWSSGSKVSKITVAAVPRDRSGFIFCFVFCFLPPDLLQGVFMGAAVIVMGLDWPTTLSNSAFLHGRFEFEA